MPAPRGADTRIFGLILAASFVLFGLQEGLASYGVEFGERDAYRVYTGLLDTLANAKPLSSDLNYGYGISRGYYAVIGPFSHLAETPARLAETLNLATWMSSMASMAFIAVIAGAFGGLPAAAASALVLGIVPLWWGASQYAHPMWPAMAFVLCALSAAIAFERSTVPWRKLLTGVLLVTTLGVGLTMRLDVILMAPMFLGACFDGRRFKLGAVLRLSLLGLLGLGVAGLIIALTPHMPATQQSALQLLAEWHNPHRFVLSFAKAQLAVARSLNPVLILCFIGAGAIAWRHRRFDVLALAVPTVVLNYLFWIPNAVPDRHFLYIVPAFALGIGICVAFREGRATSPDRGPWALPALLCASAALAIVADLVGHPWLLYASALPIGLAVCRPVLEAKRDAVTFSARDAATAAAALGLAVLLSISPVRWFFHNQYRHGDGMAFARLAEPLLALPPLGKPIIVITDAYPVAAAIEGRVRQDVETTLHIPWLDVRTKDNALRFFIQGWSEDEAVAAAKARAESEPSFLVVDATVAPDTERRLATAPSLTLLPEVRPR